MKRSTQVAAPLLAAAALAMATGCSKPLMERCVDQDNHVVDDKFCANLPPAQAQQNLRPGLPFYPYRYYYGGYGGFGLGSLVSGGSYVPDPSGRYITSTGRTTRGGFGSSFSEGGAHSSSAGE